MTTPTLLTTGDVAQRFNVTKNTVRRWVENGKLRHVRLPSGQVRFLEADIEAALSPTEATS